MTTTTLPIDSLLEAANIPNDASIHDFEWADDGLEIEYSESEQH